MRKYLAVSLKSLKSQKNIPIFVPFLLLFLLSYTVELLLKLFQFYTFLDCIHTYCVIKSIRNQRIISFLKITGNIDKVQSEGYMWKKIQAPAFFT